MNCSRVIRPSSWRPGIPLGNTSVLFGSFVLLLATTTATATPAIGKPFFVAPQSGKKTTSYNVKLPLRGSGERSFSVPRDCEELGELLNNDAADRGRILDRHLWTKVGHDCRYYALLRRHPRCELEDHVSVVDFRNLVLDKLPYDRSCEKTETVACDHSLLDVSGGRVPFPLSRPAGNTRATAVGTIPCRLEHGVFRGRVLGTDGPLRCVPDERASLRLVGVDYGDINGDGILDAVLRLVPISPEGGRRLLQIPVTRLSPDGPLETPVASEQN